jgi:hypothetical protein
MAISQIKATLNGTTYSLTYNSTSGAYEATITAPSKSSYNQSNHYYPVTVTAYDESGNYKTVTDSDATLGDKLKLQVKEKTNPVISVTNPTNGSTLTNNKPTVSWTCSDNDSGIKESTIALSVDGTSVSGITKTSTSGVYSCSYVPTTALTDGSHTLTFYVEDNDGNTQTATSTIKIDTVAPSLTVAQPENGKKTNVQSIIVNGTTSDATSSPVTLTVNETSVTVNTDGTFSTSVALTKGENTITVVATDGAGKSTTITRTVYFNNVAPTISEITITPNPVDAGKTFVLSVKATAAD